MSVGPIELDVTADEEDGLAISGPALGDLGQPGASLHIVVARRQGRVSTRGSLRNVPGPRWRHADFDDLSEEIWADSGLCDGD